MEKIVSGTHGTEFLMWLMMRGTLSDQVTPVSTKYHIPIFITGAGTMA